MCNFGHGWERGDEYDIILVSWVSHTALGDGVWRRRWRKSLDRSVRSSCFEAARPLDVVTSLRHGAGLVEGSRGQFSYLK